MQITGIMITDGGPHPATKWAMLSATRIADLVVVDEHSASEAASAARKAKPRFELDVAEIMESYHRNVQEHERAALAAEGEDRLLAPLDPHDGVIDTVEEAVAAVKKAAGKYPFGDHFKTEEVDAFIRRTMAQHAASSRDIERSWAADANPQSEVAKAYREARDKHGAHCVHEHCGHLRKGKAKRK